MCAHAIVVMLHAVGGALPQNRVKKPCAPLEQKKLSAMPKHYQPPNWTLSPGLVGECAISIPPRRQGLKLSMHCELSGTLEPSDIWLACWTRSATGNGFHVYESLGKTRINSTRRCMAVVNGIVLEPKMIERTSVCTAHCSTPFAKCGTPPMAIIRK